MSEKRKVHFLVCAKNTELIDELQSMCDEHNIIPDFLYRGKVKYRGGNIPLWFSSLEDVVEDMKKSKEDEGDDHYALLLQQSNLLSQKVSISTNPFVCCVSLHTNIPSLMNALIVSHVLMSSVIVYHGDPSKLRNQQRVFQVFGKIPNLFFVETVDDIFVKLEKRATKGIPVM